MGLASICRSSHKPLPMSSFTITILPFLFFLLFCLVPVESAQATVCLASNCLLASPTFGDVYSNYLPSDVGYYYPPPLFHFFIALVVIIMFVWGCFYFLSFRQVWMLFEAMKRDRVLRVPAVWASARHSITRDVIAQWMQRREAPPLPVKVQRIPVHAHFPLSSAKLCVKPAPVSNTVSTASSSPPALVPSNEYQLKLLLSATEDHACLIEIWFGVPLRTVALLLSSMEKFKARHNVVRKQRGKTPSASPVSVVTNKTPKDTKSPSSSPEAADGATSPQRTNVIEVKPRRDSREQHGARGANELKEPEAEQLMTGSRNRGGHDGLATGSVRKSKIAPSLHVDTNSPLPGTAPSPNNSPSHVTAESESRHLSRLSLNDKDRDDRNGSASILRPGTAATAALSVLGVAPPGASGTKDNMGPTTPIATLKPGQGTRLFLLEEAVHTMAPLVYPSGLKQQITVNFPSAWLEEAMKSVNNCPILILCSSMDESGAIDLASDESYSYVGSELTIVQFPPAAGARPEATSPAAAAAAAAAAPAASTSPPGLLPASALQQTDGEEKAEEKDGDENKEEEAASPSPTPSPVSPPSGLQDALTLRVRFDRQVIIGEDEAYDLEELYGLDENDAECIICLTDIRDVILLPCKHVCVCQNCFKSIVKCPICRAPCKEHLKFIPDAEKVLEEAVAAAAHAEANERRQNAMFD